MFALYLWLRNMLKCEEGQGMAEYALILVLIAVVVIAAVTLLGQQISSVFSQVTGGLGAS